jgi:hypothetical protein
MVGLWTGCWGGSGIEQKLERQSRAGAKQSVSTAEFHAGEEPEAEPAAEAEDDASEAALPHTTPAPL